MTGPARKLADPTPSKYDHDCVLLIAADADEAARVLGELGSVTEERFQVEWVTDLSSGIERLRDGGLQAVVLDLNLPGAQGTETFEELFRAATGVPILIVTEADTEAMARQALQHGAQDYLIREQANGYRLRRTVRTMLDRRAADAVALENEVANATLNSIGEAVLRTDIRGVVTYLNRVAEEMTGWSREEALGRPIVDVLQFVDSVSGAAIDDAVATVLREDKTEATTVITGTLVRRDGVELGIENRVTVVDDRSGNLIGAVVVVRDVGATRAASLETSRASQHDVLTNLPNRTLFNDRLRQAISLAERQAKKRAVFFVHLYK
jgi:PAS domain S-box-containing protein